MNHHIKSQYAHRNDDESEREKKEVFQLPKCQNISGQSRYTVGSSYCFSGIRMPKTIGIGNIIRIRSVTMFPMPSEDVGVSESTVES